MQELLGRLGALDPEASLGLRVIACFDELMSGGVAVHGLLSAAAALAGAPTGFAQEQQLLRVSPRGEDIQGEPPHARLIAEINEITSVWIEREPSTIHANDTIILERLALAIRLRVERNARSTGIEATRRDLATLVDERTPLQDRANIVARLQLSASTKYRVVIAPLFAVWLQRPKGPEDVVWTAFGPVHAIITTEGPESRGAPIGMGIATDTQDLGRSFSTALIALRLYEGESLVPVNADGLGGLAEMFADLPVTERSDSDAAAMDAITEIGWGRATLSALVETSSVREAARVIGVHHSTVTTRLEVVVSKLGFDPLTGLGRTRLGLAFLRWRLHNSRVLELPTTNN